MREKKLPAIIIVILCSIKLFGQGRIESDSILADIKWECWKTDKDTAIKYTLESVLAQNGTQEIIAYYSKKDTVYKIVKLKGNNKETERITCYFISDNPAFILVERNNHPFSANVNAYSKILSSFEYNIDTSAAQSNMPYSSHYKASYYFNKRKPYYVIIKEREKIRVDKVADKQNGLLLFAEEEQALIYYLKYHVFDMTLINWIEKNIQVEKPDSSIAAYNFGLFESPEGYTIYLIGSKEFDADDSDWATVEDFTPKNKYYILPPAEYKDLKWDQAFAKVESIIKGFMKSETYKNSFLAKAKAVTVGFDDGDLVRLQ